MPELVGQPIDRIDGRLKVTGRATYAYEHKIPNALRAVIVTSTIAKGKIASIDAKAAEGSQGVVAVMTHLNAPKLPQLQSQPKAPPTGRLVQVLQDDVVRYANQPVALVVADTLRERPRSRATRAHSLRGGTARSGTRFAPVFGLHAAEGGRSR